MMLRFGEGDGLCAGRRPRALATANGTRDEADVVIAGDRCSCITPGTRHRGRGRLRRGRASTVPVGVATTRGPGVGIVGTTAVQITGAIVDRVVAHLSLFQRTVSDCAHGQPDLRRGDEAGLPGRPRSVAGVHESLSVASQGFSHAVVDADSPAMAAVEAAGRENLENRVTDPDLRERLRPTTRRLQAPRPVRRLLRGLEHRRPSWSPKASSGSSPPGCARPTAASSWTWRRPRLPHRRLHVLRSRGGVGARWPKPGPIVPWPTCRSPSPSSHLFLLNGPNGPVGNFSLIEVAELQLGTRFSSSTGSAVPVPVGRSAPARPRPTTSRRNGWRRPSTPSGPRVVGACMTGDCRSRSPASGKRWPPPTSRPTTRSNQAVPGGRYCAEGQSPLTERSGHRRKVVASPTAGPRRCLTEGDLGHERGGHGPGRAL